MKLLNTREDLQWAWDLYPAGPEAGVYKAVPAGYKSCVVHGFHPDCGGEAEWVDWYKSEMPLVGEKPVATWTSDE